MVNLTLTPFKFYQSSANFATGAECFGGKFQNYLLPLIKASRLSLGGMVIGQCDLNDKKLTTNLLTNLINSADNNVSPQAGCSSGLPSDTYIAASGIKRNIRA